MSNYARVNQTFKVLMILLSVFALVPMSAWALNDITITATDANKAEGNASTTAFTF